MLLYRGKLYREALRATDAIPTPPRYQKKTYYHGTPHADAGEKILQSGQIKPGSQEYGALTPMPNRVYLSPSLRYALPYMCGIECDLDLSEMIEYDGRYGYLFVVDGRTLVDLLPDEDVVGRLLCDDAPPWLRLEFERLLAQNPDEHDKMRQKARSEYVDTCVEDPNPDPEECASSFLENTFTQQVYACSSYPVITLAGKFMLHHLDQYKLAELLEFTSRDSMNAVSHDGPVQFTEAWKFDKQKAGQLKPDGSNFFDLAGRVK